MDILRRFSTSLSGGFGFAVIVLAAIVAAPLAAFMLVSEATDGPPEPRSKRYRKDRNAWLTRVLEHRNRATNFLIGFFLTVLIIVIYARTENAQIVALWLACAAWGAFYEIRTRHESPQHLDAHYCEQESEEEMREFRENLEKRYGRADEKV